MLVEFRAYMEFGPLDVSEWDYSYNLSDEEYQRLKSVYDEDTCMNDIVEIQDIVEKITDAVIADVTADLLENDKDSVEDYIAEAIDDEEIESEDEWSADMVYNIWIDWPMENIFEED